MTTLNIYLAGCLFNSIFIAINNKSFSESINNDFGSKVSSLRKLKIIALGCMTLNIALSWAVYLPMPFLTWYFNYRKAPKKLFVRTISYRHGEIINDTTKESSLSIVEFMQSITSDGYVIDDITDNMVYYYHPENVESNGEIKYYYFAEFIYK